MKESATIHDIMTRVSVRQFTDAPVSDSDIETILRAGMAAPSAMNKQPWQFYVITNDALRRKLSENFSNAVYASSAPLLIVPCADLSKTIEGEGEAYWQQDLAAATENILLAAHALGLGAVWCGIYPISERVARIRPILDLPDTLIPFGIICIGHTESAPAPKDKWNPEALHFIR